MKNKTLKKAIASFLCLVLMFSTVAIGVSAIDFTAPSDMFLISKTESKIAPGVTENKIVTNGKDGDSQVMGYAVEVDLKTKTTGFAVGYNDYDGTKWKMQTVRRQAAAIEKKRGVNVVAAFNADIYNMQTGEPTGCLVMNNNVYKAGLGRPYFAIMKDGTPKIGSNMTQEILNNCTEAVSGFFTLVENGQRTEMGNTDDGLVPKTAVGIKADGSVIMYVADGRNYPVSVGLSNKKLADIMLGFGCVDVLNLDGGGSTTYAAKYEGSTTLEVSNNPSDGVERNVASSLFVISSAKPTGEFDHASMLPNNELYTPESTVQFSAKGVDSAGSAADLPSDGKFVLAAESASLGTITDDGLFTSNGTVGEVKVNYVTGNAVCGSTSVSIVVPDTLHIPSSEISLGFEETTDFGIIGKYQSRTVNMKAGDLSWAIADFDGNDLGESAGKFDGLTFTTLDGVTVNANVTATLKFNPKISVTVKTIIGAMPVVMYDFEYTTDKEEAENSNGALKYVPSYKMPRFDRTAGTSSPQQAAEFYEQGYPLYCWPNASLSDQESMKATIVSKDDGEPVRFGNKSLRIDYDYSSYNLNGNSNNYLRVTSPTYFFDGSPTAIGCWVYVPEGTANFVLYLNCCNKDESLAYATVTGANGIDWTGWKYVEFDLTNSKNAGSGRDNAPFGFYQGCGVFWISYQAGGPRGDKTASKIYLDNIQLIYGANVDDTVNPEILSMHTLGTSIEDGKTVLTDATNTFTATFKDDDGKYATGIDPTEVKMYIDGVDETGNCTIVETDGEIILYDKTLSDGVHSMTVSVADKFGNKTEETRYFTVDAKQGKSEVSFIAENAPVLGNDFIIDVVATDNTVESADVELKILSYFEKYWNTFRVEAGENYALDGEATYDAKEAQIGFKVNKKADASSESNVIAKVIISIPTDVPEGLEATYRVSKGALTFADGSKGSFSGKITVTCSSPLAIKISTMVVGSEGGYVDVTDGDGNAVAGANIYTSDNTLLGVTDENGRFFTKAFVDAVKKISIYAEKDGDLSFLTTSQSFKAGGTEDGLPTYVKLNATKNPESTQSISWMSSPIASADKAVAQYASKADYDANGEAAFKTVEGKDVLVELASSAMLETNYAVKINSVKISGLKADTEYVYRVGDGEKMSELKTFETTRKNRGVNFFVIGDTQATDTTNTDQITKILGESGVKYDFGIQTGDAVDNGGNYEMWANIAQVFSGNFLGNQDLIQVLGNHEYYGDDDASTANAYFDLSDGEEAPAYYSTQYGNVYVAVINYGTQRYDEAIKWIKKDAAKSDATWKILTLHQPPYYTNPSGNDDAPAQKIRDLADDVGFDVVFSGHDHSYSRTAPQTGNKVNDDGTIYYICGSTGEKSYKVVPNDSFNFEICTNEYNAVYITAEATDTELSFTTYDYTGSEAVILDSFTKTKKSDCSKNGHTAAYDNGDMYCSVCGYPIDIKNYTGFARDVDTGRNMYFLGGEKKIGWFQLGNDAYYFDENGLGLVGDHTLGQVKGTYHFDKDGRQIGAVFEEFEGGVRAFRGSNTTVLVGWHEIEGNLYYFSRSNGAMRTGNATVTVRQKLNFVFSKDGKLQRGAFYETDEGTVYYWGSDMVGGWQEIEGKKYYFNPSTHIMANDTTEIDGKLYAFDQDGTLVHEGAHEWGKEVVVIEPNCTVDGQTRYTCSVCKHKKYETVKATGHVDENGDGACDKCNFPMDFNSVTNNFFYRLWQRIIYIFRLIASLFKYGIK
ncbi:MAG: phosphodiester glycosidase family protein [Clostridia bacterium]|nr:phosphodiester glycosidase family protein [Clostridia bacterium]